MIYGSFYEMLLQEQNDEKQTNMIIYKYLIRNGIIIDLVGNVLIKSLLSNSYIDRIWDIFSKELIDYSEVEKDYNENDWKLKIE